MYYYDNGLAQFRKTSYLIENAYMVCLYYTGYTHAFYEMILKYESKTAYFILRVIQYSNLVDCNLKSHGQMLIYD